MGKAREAQEKKALNRLFTYAASGAIIIVVIYSIYYYSNAHRQFSAKNVSTEGNSLEMQLIWDHQSGFSPEGNDVFTPMFACMFQPKTPFSMASLPAYVGNNTVCFEDAMLSNTFVAVNGLMKDGALDNMFNQITHRYGTAPPSVLDNGKHEFVFYAIQYQHYSFSPHVLVQWQNPDTTSYPFKRYLYCQLDSVNEELRLIQSDKGFAMRIERPQHSDHAFLAQWRDDWQDLSIDTLANHLLPSLIYQKKEVATGMLRMPIIDFQWRHTFSTENASIENASNQSTHAITYAGFEMKMLLAPDLKSPNPYTLPKAERTIDLKPPFLLVMQKDDAMVPYFAMRIDNQDVIID